MYQRPHLTVQTRLSAALQQHFPQPPGRLASIRLPHPMQRLARGGASQAAGRILSLTTKQAVVFICVYSWVILRNIGRTINKAVHKLPWLFIVVTIVISFIVSFVFISKARAERDSYNQKLVHATQQLDSFYAAYGNLKLK